MSDLKQRIINAAKKLEEAEVPEWGCKVYIRRMTAAQREVFLKEAKDESKLMGLDRSIVAMCLCDEGGGALFENGDELKEFDSVVVDRLCKIAMRINALTKEAQESLEKKS